MSFSQADAVWAAPHDHVVQFYRDEAELADRVGRYLTEAFKARAVVIVLAGEAHRHAFEVELTRAGTDLDAARADGSWVALDAAGTMSQLLVDGSWDQERFDEVIGGVIRAAAWMGRPVRVYGEMVALLWDAGRVAEAIELEDLWNKLGHQLAFSLFCAYRLGSLGDPGLLGAVDHVRKAHSAIVGAQPTWLRSGPLEVTRQFEGVPFAPGEARHFVVDTLRGWGRHDLSDGAAFVVTELATNAVLHARSRFTVTLSALQPGVRISVRDHSQVFPERRQPGETDWSGRGLGLVAGIASDWGTQGLADGKVIWADLVG